MPLSSVMRYHEETKHSELGVRMSARHLDWENKPSPFKVYMDLPSIPLPRDFPRPRKEAIDAVKEAVSKTRAERIDVSVLAELLFFSAGLTRKVKVGPDSYYMRAASATGALYPIEVYVVSGGIPGLAPGVYHFDPLEFALVRIRNGDYRPELGAACGKHCATSPITFVFTSLAWRNAWKYQARSYRHWFWDCGVITGNLLAVCASEGLAARLTLGFVDSRVDRLLGLRRRKEATVAVAPVWTSLSEMSEERKIEAEEVSPAYEPPSKEEVDYPSIWEANEASSLADLGEVEGWRKKFEPPNPVPVTGGVRFPLRRRGEDRRQASSSLAETILLRGSTRRFAHKAITFEDFSTIIEASATGIPFDFLPPKASLVDFYMIANQVAGLPSGAYFFDRGDSSLVQLKQGRFRGVSAYLCLDQPLFGDASAVFFLMADLDHAVSSLGQRGYRAAQLEAGVKAGKLYLSSYALRIGASGSTFYDDSVTEFFSPHAKGKSTMIAVGVGVPAYRARPGSILPQLQASSRA